MIGVGQGVAEVARIVDVEGNADSVVGGVLLQVRAPELARGPTAEGANVGIDVEVADGAFFRVQQRARIGVCADDVPGTQQGCGFGGFAASCSQP